MACYVDPLFRSVSREPQAKRVGARHDHMWCHLWADSEEELHTMAQRLGMRRSWFQNRPGFPHYDLVPSKRALALRLGAKEMSLIKWLREKRARTDQEDS